MARFIGLPFLLSLLILLVAAAATTAQEPRRLILPITNDIPTKQYYVTLHLGTPVTQFPFNLVLDIGSQLTFTFCGQGYNTSSTSFRPVPCGSGKCNTVPGAKCGPDGCLREQFNPFSDRVLQGRLSVDTVTSRATDGSKTLDRVSARRFAFVCVEQNEFIGNVTFAAKGALGLAVSELSYPAQVTSALGIARIFAFCLPITRTRSGRPTSTGAFFIGGPPYIAPPYPENLSTLFAVTPLLTNPVSTTGSGPSDDYYISVTSITVDSKPLRFDNNLLSINKKGVGGTKLSTLVPYTTLHSSIYRALTKEFLKKAKAMGLKQVSPVAPFRYCFNSSTAGRNVTGPIVPVIGLALPVRGYVKEWKIYGSNSMEELNSEAMCLGFLDGGKNPVASIVIGTYQMENHLLQFDLTRTELGISSSTLLLQNTSCSNFGVEVEF